MVDAKMTNPEPKVGSPIIEPPLPSTHRAATDSPRQIPLLPALAVVETPRFHIVGYSVAGEESAVQIPELNVVFDIGKCPRPLLVSDFCLLTHGHIDHSAGLAYYLSQRIFQGMSPGTILCPAKIADGVAGIVHAWAALEGKVAPHRIVPMEVGDEFEVRKGLIARAFATCHTVPSLGYTLVDRREKLRPDLLEQRLPGHILREMKDRGEKITYTVDVPLVAYTGDTALGETLLQDGVRDAQVLITECTFFDPSHKRRAAIGRHLHLDDLLEVLPQLRNELILLAHVSRRTGLRWAAGTLKRALAKSSVHTRVEFLMDHAQHLHVRPGKAAAFVPTEPPSVDETDG